jgi:hypothetical protein
MSRIKQFYIINSTSKAIFYASRKNPAAILKNAGLLIHHNELQVLKVLLISGY